MRTSLWQFGLACLLATSGVAHGDDQVPDLPILVTTPRYERPRAPVPNTLQVERSQFRARQRLLRQEARAWRGISAGRPNVGAGSHAVNVNGFQMGSPGTLTWQPRW